MSLTVDEFNELVAESFRLKDEIEWKEKNEIDPLKKSLKTIDNQILTMLDEMDVNSFKSRAGMVTRKRTFNVRVPAEPESKQALFDWLKGKGDSVYYKYVGVNSQSLNSLYNAEMERAKEEGDFDFKFPGVGEPTVTESISRRKGK